MSISTVYSRLLSIFFNLALSIYSAEDCYTIFDKSIKRQQKSKNRSRLKGFARDHTVSKIYVLQSLYFTLWEVLKYGNVYSALYAQDTQFVFAVEIYFQRRAWREQDLADVTVVIIR